MRAPPKGLAVILSVAALLTASVIGIDCSKAKEGRLPAYKVGNEWTYDVSSEGSDYTSTYQVTGEGTVDGRDCWVIKQTISPALMGISSMTAKVDKASLFPIHAEGNGSLLGVLFTASVVYSYQPSDASYYPLAVGEEVAVTVTTTRTGTAAGQTQTETETKAHAYKVEAVEEITVEAGTFKCFMITDGSTTIWYSDKVKQDVKRIEEDGTTQELTSYSI